MEERRRGARPTSIAPSSTAPATASANLSSLPVASATSSSTSSSGEEESRLRTKIAAQQKRIDQLVAEKADLVTRVDQLERNTLEICSENNAQRARMDEANARCRHLEEENAQLRAELQAVPPVDEELGALRRELEEKTNAARDLQRRLTQSEMTSTQRARTIDSLEQEVRLCVLLFA